MLEALLWDVDGTLAETERDGHLKAFNRAFAELELPWRWSEARYAELLRVAGGRERLRHDLATQRAAPVAPAELEALIDRLHRLKNEIYAEIVAEGAVPLREGVGELIDECRRDGLRMAIATTTSRGNVAALLGAHLGDAWADSFAAVVCAEDAPRKKPDPQVYAIALARLALAPGECLAIEDAPLGVAAALAAGVPVVRVESLFFQGNPREGEVAVGPSLGARCGWEPSARPPSGERVDLAQLREWRAAHAGVPRNRG